MILCVAGNPSIDKLFVVERLRPGEIHRPIDFLRVPGGKGLNVARAARRLGAEVRLAAVLGGHGGRWIEEALREEGVASRFARDPGETRASLSVFDRETSRLTEFYEEGTPLDPASWEALDGIVAELLPGVRWLTVSGSIPPGAPPDGYARMLRRAAALGVRRALDARGPALEAGVAARPDLVKVNAAEAGELLGMGVGTEEEAFAAARALRDLAGGEGQAALVTRGIDGAVLVDPGGRAWRGTLDAWGPYPVGSGDTFLAGLVAGLDRGEEWPAAMALALGAAAANAEMAGPGRLDPGRAAALSERARVRPRASPRSFA